MKTRLLIIFALVGIVLGLSIFYLYVYYPSSHNEGIGIMLYEDPESYASFYDKYSVYQLQEEDYGKIPKIKYMMDVLLTTDKNVDDRRIVHQGPNNIKYEIRANLNEYSIQVGMSTSELDDYNRWVDGKSTYLLEYEKVVFLVFNWDKIN